MSLFRFFPYLFVFFLLSFFSCETDFDNYSTDKNHILSFSIDTLSIDTVLSTVGTKTYQFMVYNRNDQRVRISSIELQGGENSEFRINVDGMRGFRFENIEIEKNDSMYIKVEATAEHKDDAKPVLIRDYIQFITNTVPQQVVLEAYGQDVIVLRGPVITENTNFSNEKPFLIYDSLYIAEGVDLSVDPGVTFYLYNNTQITVAGSLKVNGTLQQPVVFRGDRLDINVDVPYDKIPGQWGGFYFKSTSYNNELNYVHIRNMLTGMVFERSEPDQRKLTIKNSIVTNCTRGLLSAVNCRIEGENCEFSNSGGPLMTLTGGDYHFTQCTFANYFAWGGNYSGGTVALTNVWYDMVAEDTIPMPISKADFSNSILYGSTTAAGIAIYKSSINYSDVPLNYSFISCLLYTGDERDTSRPIRENNDQTVIHCLFDQDPLFIHGGARTNEEDPFSYDFRIDSISPARNAADPFIATQIPYDMNGISRFQDEGPDMGAYEWQPTAP